MTGYLDKLILDPRDIDLARSPLAGKLDAETFILGAFNPGMTRLPNGNLLIMVRVAEGLRAPIVDAHVRAIRWHDGDYHLDDWPLEAADTSDPRKFLLRGCPPEAKAVAPDRIAAIRVLRTVTGGRVVYDRYGGPAV